jgi:NADPH-dependent curcumin reductase CurA
MTNPAPQNRRIVLAARPQGRVTPDCFRMEAVEVPQPGEGELLLRARYLSLDPYMRSRMSDAPSYAEPVALDGVMCGATLCEVVQSRAPGWAVGEKVLAYTGWQDYAVVSPAGLSRLPDDGLPPSWHLGVLGMPGLTAYVGLLDLAQPQPGETVVVAAATGPVGATVGQLAKLKGCRAVGIAGGSEKCAYAVRELGFDACLDHYQDNLAEQLAAACPGGIDIYFENVGGHVLKAVLPLLKIGARVPVCGLIAWYNQTGPSDEPDYTPVLLRAVLTRRLKLQGFIVSDHQQRREAFHAEMSAWLRAGQMRTREDVVEGLQHAPNALIGLLAGSNFGKLVVRL